MISVRNTSPVFSEQQKVPGDRKGLGGAVPALDQKTCGDRTAHLQIKIIGHYKNRITNGLCFEPAAIHSPQEPIVGINGVSAGIVRAAHAIRTTEDERSNQPFLRPTTLYETHCEMVKQLGMRGRLAAQAEIVDRPDQPFTGRDPEGTKGPRRAPPNGR